VRGGRWSKRSQKASLFGCVYAAPFGIAPLGISTPAGRQPAGAGRICGKHPDDRNRRVDLPIVIDMNDQGSTWTNGIINLHRLIAMQQSRG
jgi:hypothetical protein